MKKLLTLLAVLTAGSTLTAGHYGHDHGNKRTYNSYRTMHGGAKRHAKKRHHKHKTYGNRMNHRNSYGY